MSYQEPHPILTGDARKTAISAAETAILKARAKSNGAPLRDPVLIAEVMAEIQAAAAAYYAKQPTRRR